MNHISLSPRFFQTEEKNYSNPNQALVRELLQNAVDSKGCRNIAITYSEGFISVKDDGQGMSRETLVSKFLTMGETGKTDGATVGGFGKAKIIISFAQKHYEIISHDYKVEGEGSGYTISDHDWTQGCDFRIWTEQQSWGDIVAKYLKYCSFSNRAITVNGELVPNTIVRGRRVRELSFGDVWVNKSGIKGLFVRVNGVLMFSRPIQCDAQVIVEINPAISRDVLLSNRDSLVWEKQQELDLFVNELATENMSALERKNKKFTQFNNKGAARQARIKRNATESNTVKFVQGQGVLEAAFAPSPARGSIGEDYEVSSFDDSNYPVHRKPSWMDPAILMLDSNNPVLVKAAAFYDLNKVAEGTTRAKLLKVWMTALECVIDIFANKFQREFDWGFGYILSDDADAMMRREDGIHYFLLNPVDKEGRMRYSINTNDSLSEILGLAIHEVAHVYSSYHDERFADALTTMMMEGFKNKNEIVRTIKESK